MLDYQAIIKSDTATRLVFTFEYNYAFEGCTGLTSITIPDSVTSIGEDTFRKCDNLASIYVSSQNKFYSSDDGVLLNKDKTKVIRCPNGKKGKYVIPDSVTSINSYAFYGCIGLTDITIPDSVTSIGDYAFYNTAWYNNQPDGIVCAGKVLYKYKGTMPENTSITIPDSVTSIGTNAFQSCTGLASVTIGNNVTSIEWGAFAGCKGLKSITLSASLTLIEYGTFQNCTSLKSIIIPNSVTKIGGDAFGNCTSLESVTIPDSVMEIGGGAFGNCTSLTNIIIPIGVTEIGYETFRGCTSLKSLFIPDNVKSIYHNSFLDCKSLTSIDVSADNEYYSSDNGVLLNKEKNKIIFYPSGKKGAYTVPNYISEIGTMSFYGCIGLTEIFVPNTITEIAYGAFYDCINLTNVTLPNSLKTIGSYAFDGCTNLKNIIIPDSVTSIGTSAFMNCTSLVNITIPDGVTSIEYHTFQDCTNLTTINIGEGIKSISSNAFYNCSSLTSIYIPNNVNSIDSDAFYGCTSLTSINISNGVTSIGSSAFNGYHIGLARSVVIPNSVTYIGNLAFGYNTSGLTIYGAKNSYAETYASRCSISFIELTNYIEGFLPTCMKDGKKDYYHNNFDGKDYGDINCEKEIEDLDSWIVMPATGHNYLKGAVSPTCTERGYIVSYCSVCGDSHIDEYTEEPTGHDYSIEIVSVPTCTEKGYITYTCSMCGDSYTVDIEPTGHSYTEEEVIAPTTEEEGYILHTCENCGESYKDNYTAKLLANRSVLSAETIALGDKITVTATATGGTGEYLYQVVYKQKTQSKWTTAQTFNENSTVTFKPANATDYDVCVKVKDSSGKIVKKFFEVKVNAKLANTSTISTENITLGQKITANCLAQGGMGEYQYQVVYKQTSQSKWTTAQAFSENANVTFKPAKATSYNVCVKVKDSNGTIVKKFFTVQVNAKLTNTSAVSATTIKKGDTVAVNGSATGGAGDYTYAVYYKQKAQTKWTTKQDFNYNADVSIKPAQATDYDICVKVKDKDGTIVKKYFTVTVTK